VLAVALPGAAFADGEPGVTVEPTIGDEAGEACTVEAWAPGAPRATASGAAGARLALAPGAWVVTARCPDGDDVLATSAEHTLKPGQHLTLEPALQRAKLRVMIRRGEAVVPATVELRRPRASIDEPAATTFPASAKRGVAAGTWDVVARVAAKGSEPALVLRRAGVALKPGAFVEVPLSIADGTLVVDVSENGRGAEAALRVTRVGPTGADDGAPVAQGPPKKPITLPPGRYRVETTLSGAADFPKKSTVVWIDGGQSTKHVERFETGRLTVGVFQRGKPFEAQVELALPGAGDYFHTFVAPGTVALSPGAYDVAAAPANLADKLRRPRVLVVAGKENKIFFDVSPARVRPKVVRGGKPLDIFDAELREGGGGKVVATLGDDGSIPVAPGRYELVVRLGDGSELVDGPFEVGFGETLERRVEFARGSLTVVGLVGGTPSSDAKVLVFKPGAEKPLAETRSGKSLDLAPGTYDVKVVAGPVFAWHEGVKIRDGKPTRVDVPVAGAKGDVGGEALPEGDLPEGE